MAGVSEYHALRKMIQPVLVGFLENSRKMIFQ